jgi:hypothetical protein
VRDKVQAAKWPIFRARRDNAGSELPVAKVPQGRLSGRRAYVSAHFHGVFSTKGRQKFIRVEWQDRWWSFLGGIARQNQMRALMIGGIGDHMHLLLSLPPTPPVAKAMQLIERYLWD